MIDAVSFSFYRRIVAVVAMVVLAAGALGGCAGVVIGGGAIGTVSSQDETPPPAPGTTTAPTPGPTTPPPSVSLPAPRPGPVLAAKLRSAPKREYPALSTLAGMTPDQVIGLLGPPRFKRRDNPAEIWQYRNKACALDLFLYRVENGAGFRVRHFETRMRGLGRGGKKITGKACFTGLLQEHENRRPG